MVQNQVIAVYIALLCPLLSRRVDAIRYLESHVVNFVMSLYTYMGLYYERCLLQKEILVMMLLSEGGFDIFCAIVSDCGSPTLEWPALNR